GRLVQRRVLLLQVHLDDLLRVVPCAAGVSHKDGLKKAEKGDSDQVADEKVRVEKGKGEGKEKDHHEDVDHAFLRVLGTDLDDLLAVLDGGCLSVELDVVLDIDDRSVGPGDDGLGGSAREPVYDSP